MSGPPPMIDGSHDALPTPEFLQKPKELWKAGCEALEALFLLYHTSQNGLQHGLDGLDRDGGTSGKLASMPTFAHNITVFLDCLEYGFELVELQLVALRAMGVLLFQIIRSGDELSLVLPGIVSRIVKLVTGKFGGRTNYLVIASSIDLLSDILVSVMNDIELEGILDDSDSKVVSVSDDETQSISPVAIEPNMGNVVRTKPWLKASREQVKLALDSIITIRNHSKREPQNAILRLSLSILERSSQALSNCLPTVLDTIVFFASSNNNITDGDLRTKAENALKFHVSNYSVVKNIFEKRAFNWVESLSRLLVSHDDQQSIRILNAIQTSLELLKDTASETVLSDSLIRTVGDVVNLKPVTKQPLPVTGFSLNSKELVQTNSISASKRQLSFADFGITSLLSSESQLNLSKVLTSIGSSRNGSIVLGTLLDRVESEPPGSELKVTYFWMTMNLLKGVCISNKAEAEEIDSWIITDEATPASPDDAGTILDALYYCRELVQQATSVRFNKETDPMVCLSLQGIALVAEFLGVGFRDELVDTLYPLVEMLGHSNPLIVAQSQRAILQITQSCEYDTVQSLIVDNADYLVDGMSIKLNTLDISPRTTVILTTLINLAGPKITPYLDDLVSTMFVILDNYHGYTTLTEGIFSVFKALVAETEKGYSEALLLEGSKVTFDSTGAIVSQTPHLSNLTELLAELSRKPELPQLEVDSDDEDDDNSHNNKPFSERLAEVENRFKEDSQDNMQEDADLESKPLENPDEKLQQEWTSIVPKSTYKVIEHIVNYSDRYLTHTSSTLRYNLLELISSSMTIMASSQTDFLPLVNKIWPVITSRLDDSDTFVLEAALKCIGIACEKAGDFMTKRVVALWPKLKSLTAPFASKKRSLKFSPELRLLTALVNSLEMILANTPVPDDLFEDILSTFSRYFDLEQTKGLKYQLEKINGDAVWIECLMMGSAKPPTPPHESLAPIKIASR
ncbi:Tti1p [Sugiyamaella lignohabitans]|uniref:Tti1p n=1 Tax=Sugiyamaella lignohabitans TaxID=796027 RepID=A0A161HIN1_9ASCO|nr:Tti1p [Sugiyamaella lignohabitans]ANB12407.1 Tti1p [Sugiyamaella lignohabitans]